VIGSALNSIFRINDLPRQPVINEAAHASEADTIIPLTIYKSTLKFVCLVGDVAPKGRWGWVLIG
jgi:hypothetical protein